MPAATWQDQPGTACARLPLRAQQRRGREQVGEGLPGSTRPRLIATAAALSSKLQAIGSAAQPSTKPRLMPTAVMERLRKVASMPACGRSRAASSVMGRIAGKTKSQGSARGSQALRLSSIRPSAANAAGARSPATCDRNWGLDVQILGESRALLDEAEAGLGLRSHQGVDGVADGAFIVGKFDPKQGALAGVHGRFLELGGVHFAEPLEAAALDLGVGGEFALHQVVPVLVVARIHRLRSVAELIERRHCQKQMTLLDQLGHLLIEKGDQQ